MAQISIDLKEKIIRFAKELENDNLHISQLFLFGSYARNMQNQWSDIDIAVVSGDFTGNRLIDYDRFAKAILKVDRAIEPISYKPEQFVSENPFVKEILSTGIRII